MNRPNFFIVGAPKCGTTALYDYLNQHPQIYMSEIKEPKYFGENSSFKTESDYLALYAGAKDEIRLGEASPLYLYSPKVTEALYAFDPQAKIIIMVREPVSLMLSSYSQNRLTGREPSETFAGALEHQAATKRSQGDAIYYRRLPLFARHVKRYFERFGRENVHVIVFDDFTGDTATVYRQTLAFLGVDPDFQAQFSVMNARKEVRSQSLQKAVLATGLKIPALKRSRLALWFKRWVPEPIRTAPFSLLRRIYLNKQASAPVVAPELRRQLQAEFAPEVAQLGELLGRDLSHWSRP